jgi:hypothetical protein
VLRKQFLGLIFVDVHGRALKQIGDSDAKRRSRETQQTQQAYACARPRVR